MHYNRIKVSNTSQHRRARQHARQHARADTNAYSCVVQRDLPSWIRSTTKHVYSEHFWNSPMTSLYPLSIAVMCP